MKYRIKEKEDVFTIEEEFESIITNPYSKRFFVKTTDWVKSCDKEFSTFDEAINYIPKLEPKYYIIDDINKVFKKHCFNCEYEKGTITGILYKTFECDNCKRINQNHSHEA